MKKNVKHKASPICRALLWLMLMITAAALALSFVVYELARTDEGKYNDAVEKCKYEAYLSICANLRSVAEGKREMSAAAGEALGRYMLFSELVGEDFSYAEGLRLRLMDGELGDGEAEALLDAIASAGLDAALAEASPGTPKRKSGLSAEASSGEWRKLSSLYEVRPEAARETAKKLIGGGGNVHLSESHKFPPVYVFESGNAFIEIARSGGKVLRMCKFPLGNVSVRGEDECLFAAERFLKEIGITDVTLESAYTDGDGLTYVYDGTVRLRVAYRGATVTFFDAYEYYRMK